MPEVGVGARGRKLMALLRSMEQATGQKIELAQLPTVVDVRAKALAMCRVSCAEKVMAQL